MTNIAAGSSAVAVSLAAVVLSESTVVAVEVSFVVVALSVEAFAVVLSDVKLLTKSLTSSTIYSVPNYSWIVSSSIIL